MSSPSGGVGGWVGHRVAILTFSKKKLPKSPPWAKNNCQYYHLQMVNFSSAICNIEISNDQNPHSGHTRHSQIPWVA